MLAFLAISALVIVTPGPDTALTIRNALLGGRRGGVGTALGVATGQACWTLATSAGIAALLSASRPAFLALRLLGAAYLVYLGLESLRRAVSRDQVPRHAARRSRPFRQGLFSNLSNPKMAVFFTSLLPQFGSSVAALAGHSFAFAALTLLWLALVARAGSLLRVEPVRRAIDIVSGVVLVGFGAHLATSRR